MRYVAARERRRYQITTGGLRRPLCRDYPQDRYLPTQASRLVRGPSLAMAKELWGEVTGAQIRGGSELLLVAEDNPTYYVKVKPIEAPKRDW